MGARIEAASALTSHGLRKPTARRLADAAARACLAHAGREPGDVDMLINAGIYREDNMGEPALAALIQEDIGANLGQPPVGGHGTFSFDLINGTCGVISAIQLESGLLRSGVIRLGAIVTSDVDPNLKDPGTCPFRPAGGAMLLGWDDSHRRVHRLLRGDVSRVRRICSRAGWCGRSDAGPRVPRRAAGQSQMVIDVRARLPRPPGRLRRGGGPPLPAPPGDGHRRDRPARPRSLFPGLP